MLDKFEIAGALREIGTLLELKGENPFKAKAYDTGAGAVEALSDDIGKLIRENRLTDVRGIGKTLAAQIVELYQSGHSRLLEQLRAELPAGVIELSQVKGLSTKKIQALQDALDIKSIAELKHACQTGALSAVRGFGKKTEESLLKAIEQYETREEKIRLIDALEHCESLMQYIKAIQNVTDVRVVGSVRRWSETVSDIDLLIETDNRGDVVEAVKNFPLCTQSQLEKPHHLKLRLADGTRVDVFFCSSKESVTAMLTYTGSAHHVARLRTAAEEKGYVLHWSGLRSGDGNVDLKGESDIYRRIGLPYIPPELREDAGELEEVLTGGDFSDLVELKDVQGMVHCHTTYSDGRNSIEEMALAAEARGMDYITITDHSPAAHYAGGLDVDKLKRQWDEIERVQEKVKIKILRGTESDILAEGELDYPDSILERFDVIIASIHSRMKMDEDQMTRRLVRCMKQPQFKIWGHALGRLVLRRDPLQCRVPEVLEAIAQSRAAIEVNGDPYRLDMAPEWLRLARTMGISFVLSTDAHATAELDNISLAVQMARRGGLRKSQILNALPCDEFRALVRPS